MDTEICSVSPWVVDGMLNDSAPLYMLAALTGVSAVFTEPRSVLVVVSYASPTAYSEPFDVVVEAQFADTGTCMPMYDPLFSAVVVTVLRFAVHESAATKLLLAPTATTAAVITNNSKA